MHVLAPNTRIAKTANVPISKRTGMGRNGQHQDARGAGICPSTQPLSLPARCSRAQGVQRHSSAGGMGVPPISSLLHSPSWLGRGQGMVETSANTKASQSPTRPGPGAAKRPLVPAAKPRYPTARNDLLHVLPRIEPGRQTEQNGTKRNTSRRAKPSAHPIPERPSVPGPG